MDDEMEEKINEKMIKETIEKTEEIGKTVEIIVNEKTYISKKMNPKRKGMIFKEIFAKITPSTKNELENKNMINQFSVLISEDIPKLMWEFIKDDDKKNIGTYEIFLDEVDDDSCTNFLRWCYKAVEKINNFLV